MGEAKTCTSSSSTTLRRAGSSLGLVIPALNKRLAMLALIAAVCIAAEMLLFSGLHIYSGDANYGPMIYWLVVAAICALIAYGRFVLKPL
jgi:hypothetical protein